MIEFDQTWQLSATGRTVETLKCFTALGDVEVMQQRVSYKVSQRNRKTMSNAVFNIPPLTGRGPANAPHEPHVSATSSAA